MNKAVPEAMVIGDKRAVAWLMAADVVIGTDPHTGHQAIFFGRERIEEIARTGHAQDLRIANFAVALTEADGFDDADRLAAMVALAKGHHCYYRPAPPTDADDAADDFSGA